MQTDETSSEEADATRTWIDMIVRHQRTTPSQLAAESGVNPSTLTRFMRGETLMLSPKVLSSLAAGSPVAVPLFIQKKLDRSPRTRREQVMNMLGDGTEDKIPIWGVHPVQRDGEFRLNAVPVNFLERGAVANKSLKLAAFFAPDETMAPRWHAGEPVVFDRAKPASIGDYAVIKMHPDTAHANDEETYLFRKIGRRSDGQLHLSALDDQIGETTVPIGRILEVRHVLNWTDLLG